MTVDEEIIVMYAFGYKRKQIAQCLGTTDNVMRNRVKSILRGTGASNGHELAMWRWSKDWNARIRPRLTTNDAVH